MGLELIQDNNEKNEFQEVRLYLLKKK